MENEQNENHFSTNSKLSKYKLSHSRRSPHQKVKRFISSLPSNFVKTRRKKSAGFCRIFRRLAYPETMQTIIGLFVSTFRAHHSLIGLKPFQRVKPGQIHRKASKSAK
jgi:hypothetical protein